MKGSMVLKLTVWLSLLVLVTPVFVLRSDSEKGDADSFGYFYTDGNDPEPKITCDYINVKADPNAEDHDTSNYYALITWDLPFSFPYYGQTYDRIYISTYGAMSFVESNSNAYRPQWPYDTWKTIYSTKSPRGLIAPYLTRDTCQTTSNDRLFTLSTEIDGEQAFIVEWNTQRGGKFEAILYEGGMIKFQFFSIWSGYVAGSYCLIGIEKPDGTDGVPYVGKMIYTNTAKFQPPFAVAFTRDTMEVEDLKLVDGSERQGDRIYPGCQDYTFRTRVAHTGGKGQIVSVWMTLAPEAERIKLVYFWKNDTFMQLTGRTMCTLRADTSSAGYDAYNRLEVTFKVDFLLAYPEEAKRNVSVMANGKSALPAYKEEGEVYRVENDFELDGELIVDNVYYQDTLDSKKFIEGGGMILFRGIKIIYENSKDYQPRPSVAKFRVYDNHGKEKFAEIPQNEFLNLEWKALYQTSQMIFTFRVMGPPESSLLNFPNINEEVFVDADSPEEVDNFFVYTTEEEMDEAKKIGPREKEDTQSNLDNDGRIFLLWDTADDGDSGLSNYIVRADPGGITKQVGKSKTELELAGLPEGLINITIQAVDMVGNIGEPVWISKSEVDWIENRVVVDFTGPEYRLVTPEEGTWSMRTKPKVTFQATDYMSGVEGDTLQYRISTDGGIHYGKWTDCENYKRDTSLNVTVEPTFYEGNDNYIQFKGSDIAGSRESTSDPFPVWIDSRYPSITMYSPDVDGNGTTVKWLRDPSTPMRVTIHDWVGAGLDLRKISYKYSLDGSSFSAEIPIEDDLVNDSLLGFEVLDVSIKKNWREGSSNLLVVEAYDLMGRSTSVTFRIRIDMTPEVEIILPERGVDYLDNESVTFKCQVQDPDGNKDFTYRWISSIDGDLGLDAVVSADLREGDHSITLEVSDGVHTVRKIFSLTILSHMLFDPSMMDTDGDGMNDSFEKEYGLNWEKDDANEDPDGDGYRNIEEYYAGTDPMDKNDYPGSTLTEESFPLFPLVLMLVLLFVMISLAFLLMNEIRKSNSTPPPPPPLGYYPNPLQQQTASGIPPAPAGPPMGSFPPQQGTLPQLPPGTR